MPHVHGVAALFGDVAFRKGGFVFRKEGFNLLVGGVQPLIELLEVLQGIAVDKLVCLVPFHIGAGTHVRRNQRLGVFIVIFLCQLLHILCQAVQHLLGVLADGKALFPAHLVQGCIPVPGLKGILQQGLLPGVPGLGILHLLTQRLGQVQAVISKVCAVVLQEIIHAHPVENLKLCIGQFQISHPGHHRIGHGSGFLVRYGIVSPDRASQGAGLGLQGSFCSFGAFLSRLLGLIHRPDNHKRQTCQQCHTHKR